MLYNFIMNTSLATDQINIRTDSKTKGLISAYARDRGMSVSQFMLNEARRAMKRKSVAIEPLEPSPYLAKLISEVEKDIKSGKNLSRAYKADELDQMFADLEK